MTAVAQRTLDIPLARACAVLGLSRATVYRGRQRPRCSPARRRPPRKLAAAERANVLALLHSEEFLDQPPAEVYGTLLSRGVYIASVRTMYRILAEVDENKPRRNQRQARHWPKPTLTATGPNQIWTWDITKLRGPAKGVFYHAYVIIDLYSRYIVGWLVAERESAELAKLLFAEAFARYAISPQTLIVHSDRGAAMKSNELADLYAMLGVTRSFSRPRVSDDNPYSESQFKTLKYQPDYPGCFGSLLHARGWLQEFVSWHNDAHCHAALALFTPAQVFGGHIDAVATQRQQAINAAYTAHPERFVGGPPKVKRPPASVNINPTHAHSDGVLYIRGPEPPPEASVRPSPTLTRNGGAQAVSRAAQPPSFAREPLTQPSTTTRSSGRRLEKPWETPLAS